MIVFDGHVHIYESFDLDLFWQSAFAGLRAAGQRTGTKEPLSYFLLLAEFSGQDFFTALKNGDVALNSVKGLKISSGNEQESLQVSHTQYPGILLHLVAGRQLKTAENLELLALFTSNHFDDGLPFATCVEAILAADGLPVCPWGVGKWLGKRGRVLADFCKEEQSRHLLLGDNGGRPTLWPRSGLLEKTAARLLSGSDPLGLAGEEKRVGSYGGYCAGDVDAIHPAASLKELLANTDTRIPSFGSQLPLYQFLKKQIALRLS